MIKNLVNKIGPHNIDVLSLLFGSLLGDCHAECRSKSSIRFNIQQENSNCEYLFWYHKFLSQRNYCSSKKPKLYKRIGKKNKIRFYYKINTYSYKNLSWFYYAFYEEKKKRIPNKEMLEEYLTPLALAV